MTTDYQIDTRLENWRELLLDLFAEQLRDFRRPVLCSLCFAAGTICKFTHGGIDTVFDPSKKHARMPAIEAGLPLNVMVVDVDGREFNALLTVQLPA